MCVMGAGQAAMTADPVATETGTADSVRRCQGGVGGRGPRADPDQALNMKA